MAVVIIGRAFVVCLLPCLLEMFVGLGLEERQYNIVACNMQQPVHITASLPRMATLETPAQVTGDYVIMMTTITVAYI